MIKIKYVFLKFNPFNTSQSTDSALFNIPLFLLIFRARLLLKLSAFFMSFSVLFFITPNPSFAQAIATVGGVPVDYRLFNEHLILLMSQKQTSKTPSEKFKKRLMRRALKPLIYQLLLQQELKRVGHTVSKELITQKVKNIRERFRSEERYQQYLSRVGNTPVSHQTSIWVKEAARVLMNAKGMLTPNDQQIQTQYDRMKSRFSHPERVRARQILLELKEKAPPKTVNEVFQRAQKIHAEVLKGETSFKVLVQRHSEGPLRPRNGDMGYFAKGEMVPPVERAVFQLKDDEISPPIRSRYGWHILKRLDTRPAYRRTLKEVKSDLVTRLKRLNFHNQYRSFLKSLWLKGGVESEISIYP